MVNVIYYLIMSFQLNYSLDDRQLEEAVKEVEHDDLKDLRDKLRKKVDVFINNEVLEIE